MAGAFFRALMCHILMLMCSCVYSFIRSYTHAFAPSWIHGFMRLSRILQYRPATVSQSFCADFFSVLRQWFYAFIDCLIFFALCLCIALFFLDFLTLCLYVLCLYLWAQIHEFMGQDIYIFIYCLLPIVYCFICKYGWIDWYIGFFSI